MRIPTPTPPILWVIEMWSTTDKCWKPCADGRLSRSTARECRDYDWKYNYPKEKFRVAKYVRAK